MVGLILLAIVVCIYFIPAIVAYDRKHPSRAGILTLNLFLGWTFIGWVVSLAWAFSGERQERTAEEFEASRQRAKVVCVVGLVVIVFLAIVALLNSDREKSETTSVASGSAAIALPTISISGRSSEDGAVPMAKGGNWQIARDRSPMDGSKTVILSLTANAPVEIWLGEKTPKLFIRCKESKTAVYVLTDTASQPEYGSYDTYGVRVRIDDRPARSQRWSESTDNTALFSPEPVALARQLSAARRLRFEFTPFNASRAVAEFDLHGLSDVLSEVTTACHRR
jgi:uncharacterized membrane protein